MIRCSAPVAGSAGGGNFAGTRCYRGPLHGIPIGLKDIYETAGVATTGHSKVMHRGVRRQFHLVRDPVLTLEEDAELSVDVDQHRSGTLPRIGLNSLTH